MNDKACFIYSEECLKYDFGKSHPFRPERAYHTYEALLKLGFFDKDIELIPPDYTTKEEFLMFHTLSYVENLLEENRGRLLYHGIGAGDNPFFEGIGNAASVVAGASIKAARKLSEGYRLSFSFSGGLHHAHPDYAYGFCIVNDVVLAIKEILKREGGYPGKILYIDIDAHFGDGVVYGLYDTADVVTLSVHESGRYLFPGTGFINDTGRGEGKDLKINVPLPPYSAEYEFLRVVDEIIMPLLEIVKPAYVVVQCGTDGYKEDPLTHLEYSAYNYLYFLSRMQEFLKNNDSNALVLGGGGYVPPFASLIWFVTTLVLSKIISIEEALKLSQKNLDLFGYPAFEVNFEPENRKNMKSQQDFEKISDKAKELLLTAENRLSKLRARN